MRGQQLIHLVTTAHDRVECRHGLLKNHAHGLASEFTQPGLRCFEKRFTLQQNFAVIGLQFFGQQTHDGSRHDGLARPRLAHHAQSFAFLNAETDLLNGVRSICTLWQRHR